MLAGRRAPARATPTSRRRWTVSSAPMRARRH